jgi:hypothetical protein
MIGKTASDIINIVRTYTEESPDKVPELIKKRVEEDLIATGVVGLDNLTEMGVVAVLYYLCGLGIIENEMIADFINNEHKDDASAFMVGFSQSQDETRLIKITINFVKKQNTTFNKDV